MKKWYQVCVVNSPTCQTTFKDCDISRGMAKFGLFVTIYPNYGKSTRLKPSVSLMKSILFSFFCLCNIHIRLSWCLDKVTLFAKSEE